MESLSIEQLRELINKGELKDPLIFLESIMNGQDPRGYSRIYELAVEIDEFSDGRPSKEDWSELMNEILNHCKYKMVSLNDSSAAAKTLAEYLHAKRKHVEKVESKSGEDGSFTPLTEEEVQVFKEVFNSEF